MATQTKTERTYFITPIGRLSYINVWKPRKKKNEDDASVYDATLIMEKPKVMTPDDKKRWEDLKKLVADTRTAKWPKLKGVILCPFRTVEGYKSELFTSKPLDPDANPEYEDKLILKATSYGRKPQVLRSDKSEMMDQDELYSGCYGRLWVTAFAYDTAGNKGVSLSLQGVMKIKDGEPLGGFAGKATDAFSGVEVEDDEFETTDGDDEDDLDGM